MDGEVFCEAEPHGQRSMIGVVRVADIQFPIQFLGKVRLKLAQFVNTHTTYACILLVWQLFVFLYMPLDCQNEACQEQSIHISTSHREVTVPLEYSTDVDQCYDVHFWTTTKKVENPSTVLLWRENR